MKKLFSVLLVGVLALMVYVPSVFATKVNLEGCNDNCKINDDGTCTKTCRIVVSENTEAMSQFNATVTLTPESSQMGTVTAAEGWESLSSGNSLSFISTDENGVSDASFTIGTFTVTVPQDVQDCKITLTPDGFETVEKDITTEQQPSTGVTLPLIVLGSGLVVALGAYYVTRKNNKMYKI